MGQHTPTTPRLGDLAPAIVAATASGYAYTLDGQAGRPAILVPLGGRVESAKARLEQILPLRVVLAAAGVDLVFLAPSDETLAAALAGYEDAQNLIIHGSAGGLETLEQDRRPICIYLDRIGRIVGLLALESQVGFVGWALELAGRLQAPPPRVCATAAPVLILPNIASPDFCQRLIAHFEASPHVPGVMAAHADGAAQHQLDQTLKHRRDLELTTASPVYAEILDILTRRCIPEIKRAFQADIKSADRILIARYDDDGGYFRRHRDNGLPHTAFRDFAISLNLNTHEYEGGELLFPEYTDDRYSPTAGSAVIFSGSLLHEAAPVLKGSRYVLLTFLCTAPAQAIAASAAS